MFYRTWVYPFPQIIFLSPALLTTHCKFNYAYFIVCTNFSDHTSKKLVTRTWNCRIRTTLTLKGYFQFVSQDPDVPALDSCSFWAVSALASRLLLGGLGLGLLLPRSRFWGVSCTIVRRCCDCTARSAPTTNVQTRLQHITNHQCLNGCAPPYLSEHCTPVSSADTRQRLRSANRHLLAVPRFRLNTYGRRAFSVVGPMAWDCLPDFIRDPTSSTDCFRHPLKTYLFVRY